MRSSHPALAILAFALSTWCTCGSALAEGQEETRLWSAPAKNTFALCPAVGYAEGDGEQGFAAALRGLFFFEYFVGGIQGQAIFSDEGVLYDAGIDLFGRFGPLYAGGGFSGHWIPGRTGTPIPTLSLQAGVHIPLPLVRVFLDLAYRPSILLMNEQQLVVHLVTIGFVFETGE